MPFVAATQKVDPMQSPCSCHVGSGARWLSRFCTPYVRESVVPDSKGVQESMQSRQARMNNLQAGSCHQR